MSDIFNECEDGAHSLCEVSTSAPITVCGCDCHDPRYSGAEGFYILDNPTIEEYSVRIMWADGDSRTKNGFVSRMVAQAWAESVLMM